MTVEIGAEAALFPKKEYINEIAVAVQGSTLECHRDGPDNEYLIIVKSPGWLKLTWCNHWIFYSMTNYEMFRCFVDLLNDESVDVNKCYMEENQSTILQVWWFT